ncbi:MAG: hypothetical protein H3C54_09095 [Taibaiella sp.]|nr:hypothetical protein [Taibaiella sp.]
MKTSHQTFILEMVKHGDKELAWQKANPGNKGGNSARKAADRLLRRHPEMTAEIEEAVATIRHQAYTEAYKLYTEQQRTPLLSMMQRREILARIARGEVKVCRYARSGDRYIMLFEDPRPRDMMQAMQIDAKFEEACNRMRNINDPVLSQFNIYIDGRPCDDPAAPINTDLPPGIVMLPRKAKKMLQEATGETTENGNLPATLSHQDLENIKKDSFPVIREGGTNAVSDGRVDSREKLPQENPTQNGNPPATLGTQYTSPHPGVPIAIEIGGLLAQEKNTENGNPPATLGTQYTSPHPGDLGVTPVSPDSPLYHIYLNILEKRKLAEEDILHATWYSQHKRAEAAAPPPHILTDEEIAEMDRALAEERSRKLGQPQYSTFGKMYFPEKDTRGLL